MSDPTEILFLQQAQQVPESRRTEFMIAYQTQKKDRTLALVLSLFLGHFGIDRFFLGQIGLGVAKLLTFGGCGIWTLVDWFLIMGAADEYNRAALGRIWTTFFPVLPSGPYGRLPGPSSFGGPGYTP